MNGWMDGYQSTFYGQMETTVNSCTIVNLCWIAVLQYYSTGAWGLDGPPLPPPSLNIY